jgi:hypothetical protein
MWYTCAQMVTTAMAGVHMTRKDIGKDTAGVQLT